MNQRTVVFLYWSKLPTSCACFPCIFNSHDTDYGCLITSLALIFYTVPAPAPCQVSGGDRLLDLHKHLSCLVYPDSEVPVLCDISSIFHPGFFANSLRTSLTIHHESSMYLYLLLRFAGDIKINPGPVRFQSLDIGQLKLILHNCFSNVMIM